MTAVLACRVCGTEPLENVRFCHECGSPVNDADTRAEYKQVTVLFADVVRSMDITSAVGAERLREIMTELVTRCTAVVRCVMVAQSTNSLATGSWRCSARQLPWRNMLFAPAWLHWICRQRLPNWQRQSKRATVSPCSCGWDLTPVR